MKYIETPLPFSYNDAEIGKTYGHIVLAPDGVNVQCAYCFKVTYIDRRMDGGTLIEYEDPVDKQLYRKSASYLDRTLEGSVTADLDTMEHELEDKEAVFHAKLKDDPIAIVVTWGIQKGYVFK